MMKPENSKLRQAERNEEAQAIQQSTVAPQAQDFASVDELLRYDSERNPVPPDVAERVNASIAAEPPLAKPWYKKLFGS